MFYTYVLLSTKTKTFYIGSTEDLKRRFKEHNDFQGGMYSKRHAPYVLIYYEAFLSKTDALKQEKFYKTGYGREVLQSKIENSLNLQKITK